MGWLSEDSGVTVPAAALPFLLPLVAVILSAVSRDGARQALASGDLLARPFDRYRQIHGYG